jgi:hypothetical protein
LGEVQFWKQRGGAGAIRRDVGEGDGSEEEQKTSGSHAVLQQSRWVSLAGTPLCGPWADVWRSRIRWRLSAVCKTFSDAKFSRWMIKTLNTGRDRGLVKTLNTG